MFITWCVEIVILFCGIQSDPGRVVLPSPGLGKLRGGPGPGHSKSVW